MENYHATWIYTRQHRCHWIVLLPACQLIPPVKLEVWTLLERDRHRCSSPLKFRSLQRRTFRGVDIASQHLLVIQIAPFFLRTSNCTSISIDCTTLIVSEWMNCEEELCQFMKSSDVPFLKKRKGERQKKMFAFALPRLDTETDSQLRLGPTILWVH